MSDPPSRPRGPSEYAQKEAQGRPPLKDYTPPRRTSCFFKLIGLVLVALAGWWAVYSWKQGRIVDITRLDEQAKASKQLAEDLHTAKERGEEAAEKAAEVTRKAFDWAAANLADLQKRIKGKPPETKEEVSKLVEESKKVAESTPVEKPDGGRVTNLPEAKKTGAPPPPPAPPSGPMAEAQALYRKGCEAFAKSGPEWPQEQVQVYRRIAEKRFERCLGALDRARQAGEPEATIDKLEQSVLVRLYACRRHKEINPRYDALAQEEEKRLGE